MKLSEYAQVAEVVSGIAVVITVLLLVFEVRNNTAAVEAATYDSLVAEMSTWRLAVASNPSLLENLYATAELDSEGIEGIRIFERQQILMALFHIYERAYTQWRAGNIDGEAWERFERQICLNQGAGFKTGFSPRLKEAVTESFYEFWDECVE